MRHKRLLVPKGYHMQKFILIQVIKVNTQKPQTAQELSKSLKHMCFGKFALDIEAAMTMKLSVHAVILISVYIL